MITHRAVIEGQTFRRHSNRHYSHAVAANYGRGFELVDFYPDRDAASLALSVVLLGHGAYAAGIMAVVVE